MLRRMYGLVAAAPRGVVRVPGCVPDVAFKAGGACA
jgi:hypothetical protein